MKSTLGGHSSYIQTTLAPCLFHTRISRNIPHNPCSCHQLPRCNWHRVYDSGYEVRVHPEFSQSRAAVQPRWRSMEHGGVMHFLCPHDGPYFGNVVFRSRSYGRSPRLTPARDMRISSFTGVCTLVPKRWCLGPEVAYLASHSLSTISSFWI